MSGRQQQGTSSALRQIRGSNERDENGETALVPLGVSRGPNLSPEMRFLMEQFSAVSRRQELVLNSLEELRLQNRNYQIANAAHVAMSANQDRLIRDMFVAYQPNLDEMLRAFHAAEEVEVQRNTPQGMWQTFQSWSTLKQVIFVVVVVGITVLVGFFTWKLIGFLWPKIVSFVAVYGPMILARIQDICQRVMEAPIFQEVREALQTGNPLVIYRCCQQLMGWQSLFTILALFLGFNNGNQNNCH